jgi:hypothetical protein
LRVAFALTKSEGESIQGGRPTTSAIKNDLAVGFFYTLGAITQCFFETWNIVEPTLSPHNRMLAKQFGLLQESKEDV